MARVSSPALLDRADQLARLESAWARAAQGRPGSVLIAGEAGIGKSRLLRELARVVGDGGGRVGLGTCLRLGDAPLPFAPIAGLLRQLGGDLPITGATVAAAPDDLGQLEGVLRSSDPASVAGSGAERVLYLTGPAARMRLFEAVLGIVTGVAAAQPVLLGIEDVQWSDPATRDLLTYLTRNLATERLLLVLTLRTDGLPRADPVVAWLAELLRGLDNERIDLERFRPEVVGRQVEAITGSSPAPADLEQIWARSEGNPFFVEEILAAGLGRAPRSLAEILLARVAQLSEPARLVVRATAVAGIPVGDPVLGVVLGLSPGELRPVLREAIEAGVLRVDDAGLVVPRHALLGEVVETALLAGERRDLHEALAIALEGAPSSGPGDASPSRAAARARHWREADRPREAYLASLDAADAASRVFAHEEAADHLDRAIDIGPHLADPPPQWALIELLARAADALDLAGNPSAAISRVEAALRMLDEEADPRAAGALHGRLGYLRWVVGQTEEALVEHRRAVALVPDTPPTPERAHVLAALGGALMGAGRYVESRGPCEEAVRVAAASGASAEESRARTVLGSDLVALGELDAGLAELRAARHLAGLGGPLDLLVVAHHNLALNLLLADQREEAIAEAMAGRELARRVGLERRFGPHLVGVAADAMLRSGRWDEAVALADAQLAAVPASRATVYLSAVRARLGAGRGEPALDGDRRAAAMPAAGDDLDPDLRAYVALAAGEVALVGGRVADAIAAATEGLAALEGSDDEASALPILALFARSLADRAEDARAARRSDDADRAAAEARATADRATTLAGRVRLPSARAWATRAAADAARAGGDPAVDRWQQAVDAADLATMPSLGAEARLELARSVLRMRGERTPAIDAIRTAREMSTGLGARPLGAAIETLARTARIELAAMEAPPSEAAPASRSGTASAATSLSGRELEVLRLVAEGRTNGQIAEALFITRKTASAHVTHILDKLGVGNRLEAAMAAARLGLLADADPPDPPAVAT